VSSRRRGCPGLATVAARGGGADRRGDQAAPPRRCGRRARGPALEDEVGGSRLHTSRIPSSGHDQPTRATLRASSQKASLSQHVWRGVLLRLYRGGVRMLNKRPLEKGRQERRGREGTSTQAGEFVKEEMDQSARAKHGARPQAGHRHRTVEGAASRRAAAAPRAAASLRPGGRRGRTTRRVGQARRAGRPQSGRGQPGKALKREGRSAASSRAVAASEDRRAPPDRLRSHCECPAGRRQPRPPSVVLSWGC